MQLSEMWSAELRSELARAEADSGYPVSEFKVGGRKTKALPDGEDVDFWMGEGLKQLEKYVEWYRESGWSIATMPDGKPGIEWSVEVPVGDIPVKMFIDGIFLDKNGHHWIVDFKTGKNTPSSALQLALYRTGIKRTTGLEINLGAWYMTRKGELSDAIDLSHWDEDFFDGWFSTVNAQIALGLFAPNVDMHCGWCGVRDYCQAVNGELSSDYPLQITKGK
jgi:hypothetical protein